jgi:hypothetical protein
MKRGCIMWSRTATEDEKATLARLSSLRGSPVDYSDPDAPKTDATREIYPGYPPFARIKETEVLKK